MKTLLFIVAIVSNISLNAQDKRDSTSIAEVNHLFQKDSIVSVNDASPVDHGRQPEHWVKYRFSVILDTMLIEPNDIDNLHSIVDSLKTYLDVTQYPEIARRARIDGRVTISFAIDEFGLPKNASILHSDFSRFSDAAIAPLPQLKFTPPTKNEKYVPLQIVIRLEFNYTKL